MGSQCQIQMTTIQILQYVTLQFLLFQTLSVHVAENESKLLMISFWVNVITNLFIMISFFAMLTRQPNQKNAVRILQEDFATHVLTTVFVLAQMHPMSAQEKKDVTIMMTMITLT